MSNCGCGTKHKYCTVFYSPAHNLLPLMSCKLTVVFLFQVWKCRYWLVRDLLVCEEPYRQICEVSTKSAVLVSYIFFGSKKSFRVSWYSYFEIRYNASEVMLPGLRFHGVRTSKRWYLHWQDSWSQKLKSNELIGWGNSKICSIKYLYFTSV